ncbi:MAG: PIN domain-containing protein [Pyrinomonadaceae bacterium]|nr:PIN domain-containing protein [Pyrinomonadaceae bacterium]
MPIERLYIESCCFIDVIKYDLKSSKNLPQDLQDNIWHIQKLLKASEVKDIQVITSTLTIAECRRANQEKPPGGEVKRLINSILTSGKIVTLAQVTQGIAERARDLEWIDGINLKGADAIHIATALITGCKEFLTSDKQGSRSPLKNAGKIKKLNLDVIYPSQTSLLPADYRQNKLY